MCLIHECGIDGWGLQHLHFVASCYFMIRNEFFGITGIIFSGLSFCIMADLFRSISTCTHFKKKLKKFFLDLGIMAVSCSIFILGSGNNLTTCSSIFNRMRVEDKMSDIIFSWCCFLYISNVSIMVSISFLIISN